MYIQYFVINYCDLVINDSSNMTRENGSHNDKLIKFILSQKISVTIKLWDYLKMTK